MRILIVTYGLPYPPRSGARIRDFNLIKHISQHHSVLLLSLLEFPEEAEYLAQLKPYCELVEGVVARPRSFWQNAAGAARCLLTLPDHRYFMPTFPALALLLARAHQRLPEGREQALALSLLYGGGPCTCLSTGFAPPGCFSTDLSFDNITK